MDDSKQVRPLKSAEKADSSLHLLPKVPELYLRPYFHQTSKFPVLNPASGIHLEAVQTHDSRTQVHVILGSPGAHQDGELAGDSG